MRYGVFGGTFDPFHNGHLAVVRAVLKSGVIDRLLVVPSGYPPKKGIREVSLSPYRYYMTCEALSDEPLCDVLDYELCKAEPAYIYETLAHIHRQKQLSGPEDLFLVCGQDVLAQIDTWKKPKEIFKHAYLLVAARPQAAVDEAAHHIQRLERRFCCRTLFFPMEPIDVSARQIREKKRYDDVPPSVHRFINTHDFYSYEAAISKLSDATVELLYAYIPSLYQALSKKRLLHCLNVCLVSTHLAHQFCVDPSSAAVAGLLHDCAKELTMDQQASFAKAEYEAQLFCDATLHAPAGKRFAQKKYKITDPDILNAIYYHTTGRQDMTDLEKIIFLADKIEPARQFGDLAPIRKLAQENLDLACYACLRAVKTSFDRVGQKLHPDSDQALRQFEERDTIKEAIKKGSL